jgi:hypothetical protein
VTRLPRGARCATHMTASASCERAITVAMLPPGGWCRLAVRGGQPEQARAAVTVADLAGLDVHSARTIGVLAECGAGVAGLLAGGSGRVR